MAAKYLYHVTNIKNLEDVQNNGLIPDFGQTIRQAYGGYYDFDGGGNEWEYEPVENDEGGSKIRLDYDGILFFSEKPMLGYAERDLHKPLKNLSDVLLCVVENNDTIYHKISDDPKIEDYQGTSWIEGDLPIFIERGDYYSFEEQEVAELLYGENLIEFMKKKFPEELNRYLEEGELRSIIREVIHGSYEGGEPGDYHTTAGGSDKYYGSVGAGLLAFNENGQVLLGKRSEEVNEPGTWSYPGGKIDDEERAKESAQREFEEETGFDGEYRDLKLLDKFVDQENDFTYYTYTAIVDKFEPVLDWENDEAGWFSLDKLPSPLHFGFEAILSKIKKNEY